MAATVRGYGIAFGNAGYTTTTLGGLGTLVLWQSGDISNESDEELIKGGDGNTATVVKFDRRMKATFEFCPTFGTNAATATVTTWPTAGDTISITDANFSPGSDVWIVDGCTVTKSNTRAMMARINLSRYVDNDIP